MIDRGVKWVAFSVVLALVPLLFSWIYGEIFGIDRTLESILATGELYLITAGLCAAGVGELVSATNERTKSRLVSGSITVVLLLLAALLFAAVSTPSGAPNPPDTTVVMRTSLYLYGASVVASTVCAILADS